VDAVYGDVHAHSGLTLLLATYFYAGQIYYDFSGYTDMALGSARLFGIRLTQNFRAPYLAVSIADFWRRWHISFSRWILDYIFKPLQMSFRDGGTAGTALALVVTFAVCGAWHGVGGTFLLWGLFHGILMAASLWTAPVRKRVVERLELTDSPLWRAWRIAATFHLVCFGWIFFRANGLGDAVYVATHLFSGAAGAGSFLLAHGKTELSVAVASVAIVAAVSSWDPDTIAGERLRACRPVVRWAAYYALTAAMLFFAADRTGRFIYFQF
jgi:D-alanyl-lipoteichoic acid acyltransferase DltB (MBOAT superfamily)